MGKVICIAHQKGGVGKSTIAANLAVEFSKYTPTKIIDLDYQQSLTFFNQVRTHNNLEPLDIITPTPTVSTIANVIRHTDELIIIDSGGFDANLNRLAIALADLVITPIAISYVDIRGLQTFKQIIASINEKLDEKVNVYVLLNNINPTAVNPVEEFKEYILNNHKDYFNVFETVIRKRADFVKCFEEGKSVIEMDINSKAANEMKNLLNEIKNILFKGK